MLLQVSIEGKVPEVGVRRCPIQHEPKPVRVVLEEGGDVVVGRDIVEDVVFAIKAIKTSQYDKGERGGKGSG